MIDWNDEAPRSENETGDPTVKVRVLGETLLRPPFRNSQFADSTTQRRRGGLVASAAMHVVMV
jgi:hypothetical protein